MFLRLDFSDSSLVFDTKDFLMITYSTDSIMKIYLLSYDIPFEVNPVTTDEHIKIFDKVQSYVKVWHVNSCDTKRLASSDMTRTVQYDGKTIILTLGRGERSDLANNNHSVSIPLCGGSLEETRNIFQDICGRLHCV